VARDRRRTLQAPVLDDSHVATGDAAPRRALPLLHRGRRPRPAIASRPPSRPTRASSAAARPFAGSRLGLAALLAREGQSSLSDASMPSAIASMSGSAS
jgi:hypothetical protein